MSTGWVISDSPNAPGRSQAQSEQNSGWVISDSPTAPKAQASDLPAGADGPLPGIPAPPLPAGLQGPPKPQFSQRARATLGSPRGGFVNTAVDTIKNAGQHLVNDVTAPVAAAVKPPTPEEQAALAQVPGGENPVSLAAYRMLVEPSVKAISEVPSAPWSGQSYDAQGNYTPTKPDLIEDALPVVGPWSRQIQTEALQKGAIPALAGGAVDLGVGKAAEGAGDAAAASAGDRFSTVPGENFTPIQHKALTGVLARGTGMGKDYFPRDVATSIGSTIRQAAANNPEALQAIRTGAPDDALGGFQAILDGAKRDIDVQHEQALAPVRDTPFDMTPVQQAVTFPQSLEGFSPSDAAAVRDLRQRLGSVNTLGGANDLRMYLNRELAPQFRKNAIAGGRSGAVDSAMSDALSALRNQYYDKLANATGKDFSGLKRTESGILKAQEAMGNAAPQLARNQALAVEPKGPRQLAADTLQGARTLRGGPIAGAGNFIAERVLNSTPLGDVQQGLQRFFSRLPKKSAPAAPQFSTSLPALPASTEAPNGFRVGAAQPGDMDQRVGAPQGQAPPVPSTITPVPNQPAQLPAEAGPEGQGISPGQPAPPPPALNEATARTRITPTQFARPEPTPQRTIQVSPEGQAAIQRPALPEPTPETHDWSRSAWAEEHPRGDAAKAERRAIKLGYRIVD